MREHEHWYVALLLTILAVAVAVIIVGVVLEYDMGVTGDWHDDVEQRLDTLEQEVDTP